MWRNEVFTDTPITHHNDPAWFLARARWRTFRCAYGSSNKSVRVAAITNFAFLAKIFALLCSSGNCETKFAKIFNLSVVQRCRRWGLTVVFSVCHALGHRGQRPRLQHGSQSRGYSPSPRRTPKSRRLAQAPLQFQQCGELLRIGDRRFAGKIFADVSC